MTEPNFSVYRLLRQHILSAAKPAYLVTDQEFNLIKADGELDFYNLLNLKQGQSCEPLLNFLTGYDVSEPLEIRFYQVSDDVIAHIVLLPYEGYLIILFMDASDAYIQEIEIQQKTNDLLILSEKRDDLVKELVRARDKLANQHEALAKANQAKAKFIAGMSEDLKSPLTSILGYVSLLKNDLKDSSNAFNMIQAIERGGRQLLTLIENSIDQMHLELDELKLKLSPVDISDLLQDIEEVFLPLAKRKNLNFSVIVESLPPNKIKIDEIRLRQVLVNLLNNSIKFTEMGSIKLTSRWQDNFLMFEIYDTGLGIPESLQKNIFTAFNKDSNGAKNKSGKGLGLSISKRLIDLMDGEIECESIQGAETTFKLKFPIELISTHQTIDAIFNESDFGENAHVLVIDSNEDICELYELALTKAGFVVSKGTNADQALKLANQNNPNLVLISLDNFDNCLNTTKAIRHSGYSNPILVQLSLESSDSSRSVFEMGGNGFLTKPVNIIEMIETVKAYVAPNQSDDSDVTMRTYLKQRFNEYLNQKYQYLVNSVVNISKNQFNDADFKKLEREVHQIFLTSEMYSYIAITNAAKLVKNALNKRIDYSLEDFNEKLLVGLKTLNSEIQFILEE